MVALYSSAIIIVSSIVIYFAGKRFADSSSAIGDFLGLPRDVKGATFDAISSSLPELLVALYSVIFFGKFEVGIGTIAGSALFNLLVIPGICVFVAPVAFRVSKKVLSRDALFYMVAVFALIVCLIYFRSWGMEIALVFIFVYLAYVREIAACAKSHREKEAASGVKKPRRAKIGREIAIFLALMAVIGGFTFLLTQSAIGLSEALGIPAIIVAFTVIAAATSVPDTVISVANAKKGDIDDATSNVFGSNIFDILIGIGLPLLIYSAYRGAVEITFSNLEIVLGLLGSVMLMLYFFGDDRTIGKKQAAFLLFMYFVFVVYAVALAV